MRDQISVLLNKGAKIEIEEKIIYDTELKAPIFVNTNVGRFEIINKETLEKIGVSEIYIQN